MPRKEQREIATLYLMQLGREGSQLKQERLLLEKYENLTRAQSHNFYFFTVGHMVKFHS